MFEGKFVCGKRVSTNLSQKKSCTEGEVAVIGPYFIPLQQEHLRGNTYIVILRASITLGSKNQEVLSICLLPSNDRTLFIYLWFQHPLSIY